MNAFNSLTILPRGMFEANVEHIAPLAHQFIILEGAFAPLASSFTKDGHSTDGTVEAIKRFQQKYPQIELIQSPEGGWPCGVDRCLDASDKKITGDYLWLTDGDEFYHEKDTPVILRLLEECQPYMVEFYGNHFFGDYNHCIAHIKGESWGSGPWMRIFKNCPGESHWVSYSPPFYRYKEGVICNEQQNIITHDEMLEMGIKLYHYGFVAQSQIDFKKVFYTTSGVDYEKHWDEWQKDHSVPIVLGAKTTEFKYDDHPAVIKKLIGQQ